MKKPLLIMVGLVTGFLSYTSYADTDIPESCKTITNDIANKIIGNGVAANDFKLDIVATSDVTPEMGHVVGNCSGEEFKILYTRGENINPNASVDNYTQAAPTTETTIDTADTTTTETPVAE